MTILKIGRDTHFLKAGKKGHTTSRDCKCRPETRSRENVVKAAAKSEAALVFHR